MGYLNSGNNLGISPKNLKMKMSEMFAKRLVPNIRKIYRSHEMPQIRLILTFNLVETFL